MRKKQLSVLIAITVLFSTLLVNFSPTNTLATSIKDLEKENKELQDEKSNIDSDIGDADAKIGELQAEQDKVKAEIKRLDLSISDTTNKIREKNDEISDSEAEIEDLQAEIKEYLKRIKKRNEILKNRALSFQESGGLVSYIDVLLGAKSFSDFIDRVSSVATILEADRSILVEHNEDKRALEELQVVVEEELEALEDSRNELVKLEKSLHSQKDEKDDLVKLLKEEEEEVEDYKISLEEESSILAAQQKAIEKMISVEKKRLEEEEARRKAEEEARRKAEEEAAQNQNNSDGNLEEDNSGGSNTQTPPSTTPPVSSGAFTNPSAGYLSSPFRPPHRPNHHGIDIAQGGTVPIVAAADGYVYRSYYSPSYGEVIFIMHNINGQTYTTVYAHMRSGSRAVGEGAAVSKGQFIGYMGNTGQSFGQHLHFEVHRGDWNMSKSNAVNPLQFVSY